MLAALVCLACVPGFAESWSGALVDSRCYQGEMDNVGPLQSLTYSGRDMQSAVLYCAPTVKTKTFAVVQDDWDILQLDAAGNVKAADLVRKTGKQRLIEVNLTGEKNKSRVKVDSLSTATIGIVGRPPIR